jgi:hypothetical protein
MQKPRTMQVKIQDTFYQRNEAKSRFTLRIIKLKDDLSKKKDDRRKEKP